MTLPSWQAPQPDRRAAVAATDVRAALKPFEVTRDARSPVDPLAIGVQALKDEPLRHADVDESTLVRLHHSSKADGTSSLSDDSAVGVRG